MSSGIRADWRIGATYYCVGPQLWITAKALPVVKWTTLTSLHSQFTAVALYVPGGSRQRADDCYGFLEVMAGAIGIFNRVIHTVNNLRLCSSDVWLPS